MEQKILQAFGRIHSLGILHGDIRPDNILVGAEGDVWIIDFEFARIATELPNANALFAKEHGLIGQMLTEVRHLCAT
jgi:serine/threonine protein kinase